MKKINKAFTLVELIVVITILAILGTIAFLAYQGYSKSARDSKRISDIGNLKTSLNLFQLKVGKYPIPDYPEDVTYSGAIVWSQGVIGDGVFNNLTNINKKPIDPLTDSEYTYSLLNTKKEFQIGGILEGGKTTYINISNETYAGDLIVQAYITGDYNGETAIVSTGSITYVLAVPSIISGEIGDIKEIIESGNLAYNGFSNLPSSYSGTSVNINGDPGLNIVNQLVVVYSGTLTDLKNLPNQKLFINNLQAAYTGTEISNIPEIKNILTVNLNDSTAVTNLVADMTNNNNGGLPNLGLKSSATPSGSTSSITLSTDLFSLNDDNLKNIFDTGSSYVENWNVNNCHPATTTIINITDNTSFNTNMNGQTLLDNTIYKVTNGTYNVTAGIILGNCSAVIGESMTGVIFTRGYNVTGTAGIFKKTNNTLTTNNIILSGISIDGNKATYTNNQNEGIYLSFSSSNTFNNILSYNNSNSSIETYRIKYNTLNNIKCYGNSITGFSIYGSWSGEYNTLSNMQVYNNGGEGMHFEGTSNNNLSNIQSYDNAGTGIFARNGFHYNTLNNIQIYNNNNYGIILGGTTNNIDNLASHNNTGYGIFLQDFNSGSLNNVQSYNNNTTGIYINRCLNNTLNNTQSYSNTGDGIYLYTNTNNNKLSNILTYNNSGGGININSSKNYINNIQSYNNDAGIGVSATYTTLNNVQSYNNNTGIFISANYTTLNNIQSYNNTDGISIYSASNNILNNIQSYNNSNTGIYLSSSTGKYYGITKVFGNSVNTNSLTVGTDGYLGFSNGITDNSPTMDCDYHSQPNLIAAWGDCGSTIRGKQTATTIPVTSYNYGTSIINQIQPARWNGSAFELYGTNGVDYNTSKRIGEW